MKKAMSLFGQYILFLLLPFVAFGYKIIIPQELNEDTAIFHASIRHHGCRYHLNKIDCPSREFYIDSHTGVLWAVESQRNSEKLDGLCHLKVVVRGCDGVGNIEIPIFIEELLDQDNEVLHASKPALNISVQLPALVNVPDWVDILPLNGLRGVIPESLLNCDRKTLLNSDRSEFQLREGSVFIDGDSISNMKGNIVELIEVIEGCPSMDNQNVIVPKQEIGIHIWVTMASSNARPMNPRLSHLSRRTQHRHKRGIRNSISFSPRMKTVDISENLQANTKVTILTLNNPNNIPVTFTWHATTDKRSEDAFSLNSRTGVVTTSRRLDRENMAFHNFRVTAQGSGQTADCTLRIKVMDMNDNKPKFERTEYRFRLNEDERVTTYIGRVTASDDDTGDNQLIQYSIEGLQPRDVFLINNDGEITLGAMLDREKKSQYSFNVVAKDSGTLPQRSSTRVIITVGDVNDNSPVFTKPKYSVSIGEDTSRGTRIETVKATDSDAGENGKVKYSIVRSQDRNYFSINQLTGEFTVISDISFADHPDGFRVRVQARDSGRKPKSSNCDIVVNIVDINDNTPQFLSNRYVTVISEDRKPPYDVIKVKAVDPDAGDNARIAYSFVTPPANLPFRINNTSGQIILVRGLDFEIKTRYVLTVRGTDHGHPPKSSTTSVEIKVRDVNDNAPTFTSQIYREKISETMNIGEEVTKVIAKDADKDSTLLYSIITGNQFHKFAITTRDNEGIIRLAQKLNFNERRSYVLTVMCSDGANSNTAQVRINVTDANTHTPEFDKSSYETSVKENVPIGTSILRVHATDRDVGENARITYELQEASREFRLDARTGDIRTKVNLDYDTMGTLYLTVVAKDNGIPRQQTETLITVYLEDVNDNAPVFSQPTYSASVKEDIKIGRVVTDGISATDKDSGRNGQVWYTFEGGDDGNGYFSIDQSSGVIRTAAQLDREYISEYTLTAYAKDRGTPSKETKVTIHITVLDVDDNPPQFPSDVLTFYVPEDKPAGSVVATLKAVDPDSDGQSKVLYDLISDSDLDTWELNFETGELRPMFELDYETQANYTLRVSASSGELLGQVEVHINLIDVNDNEPILSDFEIIFNNYRTHKPYTFPFGPIGKIPAHDPDVTSVLNYRFTAGNNNSLLILNETTGELRLSSKLDNDREFTATFKVEVSDGKFSVSGDCILKVVPITDEMLTNSVTVRVEQVSQEHFLSNIMKQFTHGLGRILNVSTQDVYIFNVQNDTDVTPHAVVNVSFSARHPDGYYFTTQHLQEQVYLNRSLLTNYSMQNVMPFDDNICLREPCENYMRCVSALYFNSSASFVSTDTVLFRPIHPVSGLRCKCPEGFAGRGCENEVNLCHPAKCKNGGQCISVEGGYVCECNGSFAGQHCEVNLVGSQCSEVRDICRNDAKCHQYPAGGFRCECNHPGVVSAEVTNFCELRGRSFQKGDFIMFSGITRQWRFTISLSFATREKSGLLLYNGRFNHEHDYLALEIIDGQVQLNFSTGQNFSIVSPYIPGGVSDGKWHTVQVEYRNKPKREIYGKGSTGPSNIKVVTVTIDPETCDPAISSRLSGNVADYTCSKTAEQGGTKSSLDLTTPLLIGGVPRLPEAYQVRSRHYIGCIRDLRIDHSLVDMSDYVANYGSQPGCKALRNHCSANPCSRGTCETIWDTYKCNCEGDYGGRRCERILPVHRYIGRGCLKHKRPSQLPKPMVSPWKHSVSIRTTKTLGTILHIKIGTIAEAELMLRDGKFAYSVRMDKRTLTHEMDAVVNDGEWHEISVEWKEIGTRIIIGMNVDENFAYDNFVISTIPARLTKSTPLSDVYLGGKLNSRGQIVNGFNGCIRGLEFTSTQTGTRIVPATNLTPTRGARVTPGCQVQNPCSGSTNPCPDHSTCIKKFDTNTCECNKGYIGENCQGVCVLNPCKNGGVCLMRDSEQYGYKCQCPGNFYGRTCESEHIRPCPSGWWGDVICTPCNCDVERNFDQDCNQNGGVCKCKKHHYYSSEKDMCLPCNCHHVGSTDLDCADESGQCDCKPTVIGKKCDQCSSNFAEVQDKGCSVLYGMCPQAFVNGITWRRADFGETVPARCPRNTVGHATRVCSKEKGWLTPMLGNCTSSQYNDLEKDLKNMEDNPDYLEEHSVRMTMDAVTRLHEASDSTENLQQGDILMSYKLTMKILDTQKDLSGFDLTASRRRNFNSYLIESTSHALDDGNLDYWKTMQVRDPKSKPVANSVNAAQLLHGYEDYITTLARNMKSMWYPAIDVRSENLQLHIRPSSNIKEDRIDIGSTLGDDRRNFVSVNMLVSDDHNRRDLPKNGTVGVLQFFTLGDILPMWFHDSRLDMRRPQKGFINSPVVSVVSHDRVNRTSRPGRDLISITFTFLRNGGSNPQCVFWNFTARSETPYGGWSQKGCYVKKSNKTHITCVCSHLTTFAIVSDEEVVSVLEELPVKIVLYASVIVIVLSILVCLGLSLFLEDIKSNHSKIHNNFSFSVLLSEICFAVGIMQTENTYACMAIAIFIHFFFMSTLAWVFVEGLHLYRMLKEKRNVDRGNMRVYYLIGWGVPAIITALSVGLDAKGFGNANFCWIRTDHLLVWSFAGPLLFCAIVYVVIFCMTLGKYFASKLPDTKLADMRSNLRASFILLPVVSALWALALFAVNENKAEFYYLFALCNILLGVLLLLLHCIFNKEVRNAIRTVKEKRWQRAELNTTKQHLLKASFSQTPDTSNGPRRINNVTSASSTSTTNTRRHNHQDSSMFHDHDLSDMDLSEDSDSDLSSTASFASTHSSDEDDPDERPSYLNMNNSNNWQYKNGHLPVRKAQNSTLVVHSTPKDKDLDDDDDDDCHSPYNNGTTSSKSDTYKNSLPTVSESNQEHEHETPPEEPHYLAMNSNSRKDKQNEEKIEMIPMQDMDSLPKKGILKNGRRSKPPTPVRTDSLQRRSPMTTTDMISDDTSLLKKKDLEKIKVIRNSPLPSQQDEIL